MWPECHHQLQQNLDLDLRENVASLHTANYTNQECEMYCVSKSDLVSNSPDFISNKYIWTYLNQTMQPQSTSTSVTIVINMNCVIHKESGKDTVEEINHKIDTLDTIVFYCITVNRGNSFHARSTL
jgi:hypothetical protein